MSDPAEALPVLDLEALFRGDYDDLTAGEVALRFRRPDGFDVMPTGDAGTLDVERLALAIAKRQRRSYVDMIDTLAAKEIAAEYARLSSSEQEMRRDHP